jgi:enoyl-CoA hydratase/carnithine racemase
MPDVVVARDRHVATLTLNRPERLNAISGSMLRDLGRLLAECDTDPDIRVIVLTGAGRGFCSGLDLAELVSDNGEVKADGGLGALRVDETPPLVLRRIDVPVICALNGPAAGYGMDLALSCDFVLASDTATFTPPVRRGVIPESGGTWILPRLIGWQRACEVALLGRVLPALELLRLGLVNLVVTGADLEATTTAWAEELTALPPLAIAAAKRTMRLGLDTPFEANTHHVLAELRALFGTRDFAESIAAFRERRPPRFEGR